MSATDEQHGQLDTGYPHTLRPELHKALIARGIDYWVIQGITFWNRDDGSECLAYGYQANGVPKLAIKVVGFTDPEQAVEATLGRGTCKVDGSIYYDEFGCWQYELSCGCRILWPDSEPPTFCPECGRRVEE